MHHCQATCRFCHHYDQDHSHFMLDLAFLRTFLDISSCLYINYGTAVVGKGIPNNLAKGGCPAKISEELLPQASVVADMYQQDVGSCLTRTSTFGTDPFSCEEDRSQAEEEFADHFPDITQCFDQAANYDFTPFKEAILHLINVTRHY